MTDTLDKNKITLAKQAIDAQDAIRVLRAYGSEREVLDCDVLGPQYVEACAKLAAAQNGHVWGDMYPMGRDSYLRQEVTRLLARHRRTASPGWRCVAETTLREGLRMFAEVGGLVAWFFGTFIMPIAFAIAWSADVASPSLRALFVLLGALVMGIAYNVAVAGLSGAIYAACMWWRERK